jgi:hypothetical protein
MKSFDLTNKNTEENWSDLEYVLQKNLQPVSPRSVFIHNLRSRLENPDHISLETSGKTRRYTIAVFGLIFGLLGMVLTAWIIVNVLLRARKRRSSQI